MLAWELTQRIWRQRRMIMFLAEREFLSRYAGTWFGFLWAWIQPVATVLVLWWVFSFGIRIDTGGQVPFLLHMVSGLVPWLLFSDVLTLSTQGVRANVSLIKKTLFPIEVMPVVYVLTAALAHAVLLLVCMGMTVGHDLPLGAPLLAIPFLFLALAVLAVGLGWTLSALNVMFPDVGYGVPVILNLWFWATPVVWDRSMLPTDMQWILDLNPMSFIVEGYRAVLLYARWPPLDSLAIFFALAGALYLFGALTFQRFKIEFAEYL